MVTTVTAAARVIAVAAYAICAVITFILGVKSGSKTVLGLAIIEAVSWLTVGVLFLLAPVDYIMLPAVLGMVLSFIPMLRGVKKRGQ